MKVVGITNLFPDVTRPGLAPFNKQQILHLAALHELRLIVPVPWTRYATLALSGRKPAPPEECRDLVTVRYPPYFYTPGIMRRFYGAFYERSIAPLFERPEREAENQRNFRESKRDKNRIDKHHGKLRQ